MKQISTTCASRIFFGLNERSDEAALEKRSERRERERGPKKKKKIRTKAKVNSPTKREQPVQATA